MNGEWGKKQQQDSRVIRHCPYDDHKPECNDTKSPYNVLNKLRTMSPDSLDSLEDINFAMLDNL